MDEKEYRAIYQAVNEQRCPFEKTLLNRAHQCERMVKHNIGDREAAGCDRRESRLLCSELLHLLREKARFSLQSTENIQRLGHSQEIRIQAGGLTGLAELTGTETSARGQITNIDQLVEELTRQYDRFEEIPFSRVMPAIARFEGRRRKQKK